MMFERDLGRYRINTDSTDAVCICAYRKYTFKHARIGLTTFDYRPPW